MKDHKLTITSEPEEYPIIDMEVYLHHLMVCPICGYIGGNCDQKKDIIRDKVRYKFFWEVDRLHYHGKCPRCNGEWDESAIIELSKKRRKIDWFKLRYPISGILTFQTITKLCTLEPDGTIMTDALEISLFFLSLVFLGISLVGLIRLCIWFVELFSDD